MTKVTIGFLLRHYSRYVVLFFVDMEDKFLIGTFGGIQRMLIVVFQELFREWIFYDFLSKSCSCWHFVAQSVVVVIYFFFY